MMAGSYSVPRCELQDRQIVLYFIPFCDSRIRLLVPDIAVISGVIPTFVRFPVPLGGTWSQDSTSAVPQMLHRDPGGGLTLTSGGQFDRLFMEGMCLP